MLVYAVGDEHPMRAGCRGLLAAHADGRLELATSIEVLQEFAHVRARRRSRDDAAALTRHYAEALVVVETTAEDLDIGLDLFAEHRGLGAFDAVLAGLALGRAAQALVSADAAFSAVRGLRHIDPSGTALDDLLGGDPPSAPSR